MKMVMDHSSYSLSVTDMESEHAQRHAFVCCEKADAFDYTSGFEYTQPTFTLGLFIRT